MRFTVLVLLVAFTATQPVSADDAKKLRVLIIDGQNNHKWEQTTPVLKKYLDAAGRFTTTVATSPPKGSKEAMAKFQPDLTAIDVVVSNYNGEPWSKELNTALETGVKSGKLGYVVVHAANNAFGNWPEYYQMIGMGWQGPKFGRRMYVNDAGETVFEKPGEGQGAGHRYVGPFSVTIRNAEHPVTKGMPKEWLHHQDELYDNMRGRSRT
jgi:uncharacterized protein